MLAGQSFFAHNLVKAIIAGLLILSIASCGVVPRHYPKNKPFVFKYKINVEGNLSKADKEDISAKLVNQLDDSIRVRAVPKLFYKGIYRPVLTRPPVYDAANADKSVLFMRALLNSLGYFRDSITYKADTAFETPDKYPTNVTFTVKPGKLVTLDSIWYNIKDTNLQNLTNANMKESLLKKGDPFAKQTIGAELDRLVELYRNNGYLRITREELVGVWDTLDVTTLQPTFDPLEQIKILEKLAARREKPTANLEIRLRPGYDSVRLVKYYVGTVNIYPDYSPDTAGLVRRTVEVDTSMYVIQYRNKFKPKIFPINVYLKHGTIYGQRRHQRTINRLNSLGTWRLINIPSFPRPGQDTVDFSIQLTPADKYLFNANLEASQNQSAVSGNLFGIGVNTGIQNRNFARAANQSNTNVRYGVELGSKFVQTQQASFSHTIYFPRPVPNLKRIPERLRDNVRTVFSFNAANTERRELYNLTTLNSSWGYEFQRNIPRTDRSILISLKVPNIEYSYLKKRDSLDRLIASNPSLKSIFTDGFVSSVVAGITYSTGTKRVQNIYSLFVEESGLLTGLIPSKFLDSQLYRFIKINAEATRLMKFRNSAIALHAFAGIGYEFNSTVDPNKRNNLPFFKQYFAGGPNSMRAWRLRKLGPGSVLKEFQKNPERYGDVQLEFNAEYRFTLGTLAGFRVETALFTDIGNIWFLKSAAGAPEEVFNFSRLGKDLGIGAGIGFRLDFTFFLVRLDYAYKVKDPTPDLNNAVYQNKWFYDWKLFNGQLQIGINYPFKL